MALESDVVQRITREVTLGLDSPKKDSKEEAAFRSRLAKEVATMEDQGMIVDIPTEWPEA